METFWKQNITKHNITEHNIDKIPVYDPSTNKEMTEEQEAKLLNLMKGEA